MQTRLAATWPSNELLPAIRDALAGADDALLCVAFANRRGVNLLAPQLAGLGSRCRLVVTSVFGGQTTGGALAAAADLRVQIRVLNPSVGTFHPKLYLARTPRATVAVVGSANLTSGLIANIEGAIVLSGTGRDQAIVDCWELAENLWEHPPPNRGHRRRPRSRRTGSSPTSSSSCAARYRSDRSSPPSPRADPIGSSTSPSTASTWRPADPGPGAPARNWCRRG